MPVKKHTVVVLGSKGMLGHQVKRVFEQHPGYVTEGVSGSITNPKFVMPTLPGTVINCIGVTPRSPRFDDQCTVFETNAVLPHKLHAECARSGVRLIHISTDCVFLGSRGNYSEKDKALTIRTSLIGPELKGHKRGLLEWFLSQQDVAVGYSHSIFSGLTTIELAKVLRDFIVPNPLLAGVMHVGGDAISKYDLLHTIQTAYQNDVKLACGSGPHVDRSLDSRAFRLLTGYAPPSWTQMIREMHHDL
jgi:dTDP-4-dehydrorhamnose reductase